MAELTAQQKQESLVAAVDKRTALGHSGLTPEQITAATHIRDLRAKGMEPRPILQNLRDAQVKPHDQMDLALEQNVGTKIDPVTGKKDATDIRRQKMKIDIDRIKEYLDTDIDKLVTTQPHKANEVIQAVSGIIGKLPDADTLFPDTGTTNVRREVALELLRNPRFREKVKAVIAQKTDESTLLTDMKTPAEEAFDQADAALTQKNAELNKVNTDLGASRTRLPDYDAPSTTNPKGGSEYQTMDKAAKAYKKAGGDDELANREQSVTDLKDQIDRLRERQADARAGKYKAGDLGIITGELSTLTSELSIKNRELAEMQRYKATIDQFEQNKRQLEQDIATLETQADTLGQEKDRLSRDRLIKLAEKSQRTDEREKQEQQFEESLSIPGVFSEAAMQFIDEENAATMQAKQQELEEQVKNATTAEDKALVEGLLHMWEERKTFRKGTRWEREDRVENKAQIQADYERIVKGDISEVIRATLEKGNLPPAEAQRLANDPEYVKKNAPQVVESVLMYQARTGKINPGDAKYIINTYGKEMIPNALKRNKELNETIKQLRDEGVLKGDLMDSLRKASNNNALTFLLLLLGAIGTVGLLPLGAKLREALKDPLA